MKSSRPIIDENIIDRTRKIFLDLKLIFNACLTRSKGRIASYRIPTRNKFNNKFIDSWNAGATIQSSGR